jgi:hypothetical protein
MKFPSLKTELGVNEMPLAQNPITRNAAMVHKANRNSMQKSLKTTVRRNIVVAPPLDDTYDCHAILPTAARTTLRCLYYVHILDLHCSLHMLWYHEYITYS